MWPTEDESNGWVKQVAPQGWMPCSHAILPSVEYDNAVGNSHDASSMSKRSIINIWGINYIFKKNFFNPHPRIYSLILERGTGKRGREGERERETLIGCLQYTPGLGIEPAAFWCKGYHSNHSNQLSHLARASLCLCFKKKGGEEREGDTQGSKDNSVALKEFVGIVNNFLHFSVFSKLSLIGRFFFYNKN